MPTDTQEGSEPRPSRSLGVHTSVSPRLIDFFVLATSIRYSQTKAAGSVQGSKRSEPLLFGLIQSYTFLKIMAIPIALCITYSIPSRLWRCSECFDKLVHIAFPSKLQHEFYSPLHISI